MSSPYPVLYNRRIDQWKVIELKEELKRRKLMTKGLKDDLIKRLGEAIRNESEVAQRSIDDGSSVVSHPEVGSEGADIVPVMGKTANDMIYHGDNRKEVDVGAGLVHVDDSAASLSDEKVQEDAMVDAGSARNEELVVRATSVESSGASVENVVSVAVSAEESQNIESKNGEGDMEPQLEIEDSKPQEDVVLKSFDTNNQVSEVSPVLGFQVKSDPVSADSFSINEENKLKDNLIGDNVTLEQDVKSMMLLPSSGTVVQDGGKVHLMDVEEPCEDKVSVKEKDGNNPLIADVGKENNSANIVPSENLNADQSFGDDSIEPDALESKGSDSKYNSDEVGDVSQKAVVPMPKEDSPVDIMQDHLLVKKKDIHAETENGLAALTAKRKLQDQETVGNNEVMKRQRKWNSESLNVPELQSINFASSTTPTDTNVSSSSKCNFAGSESAVSADAPKERVVPPSSRPPTNSLRVDRFLRPFTLKAVQELLGKTGNFTSFWMDHIKTHCYVTYTSVEEAMETRNALYNLQWPPNGGRLLVAEFVDPQEVKMRVEAPSLTPTPPVGTGPPIAPAPPAAPRPSPRQHAQRPQLLPPTSLPPPPPLAAPSQAREPLPQPSPSSLPEKVEPPIVTLDDLFRKTKATPRIYYLPLSDEQVAAKLRVQGKNVKQSAGVACRMELLQARYERSWSWPDDRFGYNRRLIWVEAEVNLDLAEHKLLFLFVRESTQPCSSFVSLPERQRLAFKFYCERYFWHGHRYGQTCYLFRCCYLSTRLGSCLESS